MADIQDKILDRYGIDIAQDNIFKLYKIENPNVTDQEVYAAIQATRERWNKSINGSNEKYAKRDSERLRNAEKYEAILKDPKLRKEVYAFYNGGASPTGNNTNNSSLEFAREYFKLIETSTKIKKKDVDFFLNYYHLTRESSAIKEMLKKEFKVYGLGKGERDGAEDDTKDVERKEKNSTRSVIVNLFQKETVLKLGECMRNYNEALQKQVVCAKYPKLREGLYEFLDLNRVDTIESFKDLAKQKADEVYSIVQDLNDGKEFKPLNDVFNTLRSLSDYQDVRDNYTEFKLLIKYPSLTPYMYSFVEVKPSTLKGIMNVANREYVFRDETDFLLNYYIPVHDNFGLSDGGISAIIKKAEKKAKSNKILNQLDQRLGRKKKRKTSVGAEILHWLVYWPVFIVYFIFEIFKFIFTHLYKITIPVFVILFIGSNWLFPKIFDIENLLIFRNIIFKEKWYAYLDKTWGEPVNGFVAFILTLCALVVLAAIYVLPAFFASLSLSYFSEAMNKRFDWIGLERTYQKMIQQLRSKMESQYNTQRQKFFKQRISKAIINLICLGVLIAAVILFPIGMKALGESTGYGVSEDVETTETSNVDVNDNANDKEDSKSTEQQLENLMVVTAETANIRFKPETGSKVRGTASKGTKMMATGKTDIDSEGATWYEVYLDEDQIFLGWVIETEIAYQ